MRRISLAVVMILVCIFSAQAQKQMHIVMKDHPVICYARIDNCASHVDPPQEYLNKKNARIQSANIEVTYDENFPAEAQIAFDYAVGIWETLISSPITIKVQAKWSSLAPGVLGSAIYWSAYANFDGAQKINVFYPIALAEKMAGKELNDPNDYEILANFSKGINWYFGIDGSPGSGQYDFATVVLHELGHGLGFSSSFNVDGTNGEVGAFDTSVPIIFDVPIENASNVKLVQGFTSPSAALKTQLTSNNLKINILKNSAGAAKLYAPTTYNPGSSISHLDESTYPAGNANALMSPQIGFQEVNHDPGPLALGIMSDLGWEKIKIQHQKLPNTENETGPYIATVSLINDGSIQYDPTKVKLFYTSDNTTFTEVVITNDGGDQFTATIPTPPNIPWTYGYYISVGDNVGRTVLKPGKVVTVGEAEVQDLHVFEIGPDTKPPIIEHVPKSYLKDTETQLIIEARISDNIGIGSATIEYAINNGSTQMQDLTLTTPEEDSVYTTTLDLGAVSDGDIITYKITAIDNSNSPKTTISPASGTHSVGVFGFTTAVDSYKNDFSGVNTDFFGSGFSIATPSGFSNAAIHSVHPYSEGDAYPNNEIDFVYLLKKPIRVANENTLIRFDEIVLVEPGDAGSVFGDQNFYDFVIVEGSNDLGETWSPLGDGYDSRSHTDWLSKFNSSFSGNNSTALGIPSLYHTKSFDIAETFHPGDEVIIRFRLYSDQLAAGWGWAIDNLYIQDPITEIEKELQSSINIYPNPTKDLVTIEASGISSNSVNIQLFNTQGQSVYSAYGINANGKLYHRIPLSGLSKGLYFVKVNNGNESVMRKILITD